MSGVQGASTALRYASTKGQVDAVEVLLAAGAYTDFTDIVRERVRVRACVHAIVRACVRACE